MPETNQGINLESSPEVLGNTNIARYISQRCEQDTVYKASGFARLLSADQRPTYVDQMQQTAREITGMLEIDDELFTDEKHYEAFFAACDSWLVNETNKDNSNYEVEKTFLNQFVRILAGDKSQHNIKAAENKERDSGLYIAGVDTEEDTKHRAEFQTILEHSNLDKTTQIEKLLNSWGEDSPLKQVREALDIPSKEQEAPFRIKVVEASKERSWNSERDDYEPSEWEKLATAKVKAFTSPDPEDGVLTIFINDREFKDLLEGDDEREHKKALGSLGHEYVHTQRMMRIGAHTYLGRFWDEHMALYASQDTGHWDTTITFQMMDLTLSTETDEIPLWDAFKKGIKSDQAIAEFYKYVSDNFGLRSALLLMAVMPSNYIEPYGIDTIPEIRLDSTYRADDLLKAILDEREKIEPGSKDHLVENLKDVKQSFIQGLILVSGIEAHMQLPDYIRQVLKDRNEDKGLGNILV